MLHSIGRVLVIFAIFIAIGLHWVVLQSIAWTTMIVENAKEKPLSVAIMQTFDGTHPCSLCHAVNTGTHSQKKNESQSRTPKIDIICLARTIQLLPPSLPFSYSLRDYSFSAIGDSPPVPPPRELVA